MKTLLKSMLLLVAVLFIVFTGCQKNVLSDAKSNGQESAFNAGIAAQHSGTDHGATQISGIGFFDETGDCDSELGEGSTYVIKMTGDLEGCHYVFIDEYDCSPSGTYREKGRELFVGTYKGESGTFWTGYKFEGKYVGCAEDGSYLGAEIFGRCQHPVVENSGTGVFEGVTGRLDFKDDIAAGNFPFRGHLKF